MTYVLRSLLLALLAIFTVGHANAQAIIASDKHISGTKPEILLTGLTPGSVVRLDARRGGNRLYEATATFLVGSDGMIDLDRDAPVTGTWTAATSYGPFFSWRAIDKEPPANWPHSFMRLFLDVGDDGSVEAVHEIDILQLQEWAEIETLPEQFPGAFLIRPEAGVDNEVPVVIVLTGSDGGTILARRLAAPLLEEGYAVVGFPYYSPPFNPPVIEGLPSSFTRIPADSLLPLTEYLSQQPGLTGDRIALVGQLKGAELAILAASKSDLFAAVAAIVPSDVVGEGFGVTLEGADPGPSYTWAGKDLPYVPFGKVSESDQKPPLVELYRLGREQYPEKMEEARIAVENIKAPLLLVGSFADQVWPSGEMVSNMVHDRTKSGLETHSLIFVHAGHDLGQPPDNRGPSKDFDARLRTWETMLDFLGRHLRGQDQESD